MFDLTNIIISCVIGGVSGWIASIIMKIRGGLIRSIILGIIGGIVGSYLFHLVGIPFHGYIGTIIVSVIGSCLVVFLASKLIK